MRSRYALMKDSTSPNSLDPNGIPWKDPLTIPLKKFRWQRTPQEIIVSSADIVRIDVLINNLYGIAELDDIILWLNSVDCAYDLTVEQHLLIPNYDELNSFYTQNTVS